GDFSFLEFYARRIRRIFPALLVVLVPCLAYGALVLLPTELAKLGESITAGAAFLANVLLWSEAGYFDTAAVFKPLLHLWSLGVEEQFYIFWPALLWLAHRLHGRRGTFLGFVFLCSFGANIALYRTNPAAAFYLPFSRIWELAAGSVLALAALRPFSSTAAVARRRALVADMSSIAGLAIIAGGAAYLAPSAAYPGWLALIPVAGSMLLIAAGPAAVVNRAVLSRRFPVFIGLISYPLYLWHWPLIAYAYIMRLGHRPTPLMAAGLVAASVILAWLTYRLIEKPVRFGYHLRAKSVALVVLMGVMTTLGAFTWGADGFARNASKDRHVDMLKINLAIGDGVFRPTAHMRVTRIDNVLVAEIGEGRDSVLLTGDSLLFQYGPRVERLFESGRLKKRVYFVVGPSCAPFPGIMETGYFAHCRKMPQIAADLATREKIGTVVIGASWQGYHGQQISVERAGLRMPMTTPEAEENAFENLEDYVRQFVRAGRKVYLVLSPPTSGSFDPKFMVRRSLTGYRVSPDIFRGVRLSQLAAATRPIDQRITAIAARTGAQTLDPTPNICGPGPVCSAFFDDGEPKYADGMHLRPEFVKDHITFLDPILASAPK
ncbi:MAG: acyltransferase family protein, partial [Stellaceae bacterium]